MRLKTPQAAQMVLAERYLRGIIKPLLCMVMLLVLGGGWSAAHAQGKGKFTVQPPQFSAEALEFTYFAPYPGMTKVLLYDDSGHLVWRGQYIDPEGENKLRLRSNYLSSGAAYVFQFEYKLELIRVPVVAP